MVILSPWSQRSLVLAVCLGSAPEGLQANTAAEETNPTTDEQSIVFSRPPYSEQKASMLVYYCVAGFTILSAILMLVAANLDQAERRARKARSIVPEESIPCAIAEQYYLDGKLMALRSSQDFSARKKPMGFFGFMGHYGGGFVEAFSRNHLCLSFLIRANPTFSRIKRGLVIVTHLYLCMLVAAMAMNIVEHEKPKPRYELFSCPDQKIDTRNCTATLPLAMIAAAMAFPVMRFISFRQMRLCCFLGRSHPTSSLFPLNVRKFAAKADKTTIESALCKRNLLERKQWRLLGARSFAHRAVSMFWQMSQPSIKDLRFRGRLVSWAILAAHLSFIIYAFAYVLAYTSYLKDSAVFHWLVFTLTMFGSTTFVVEPLHILTIEVFRNAAVAALAQRYGIGAHALAGTTKYRDVVRTVDSDFVATMRTVGALRVQRWWLAVLDMYRAIHEQTAAAVKIQAVRKKMIHQKKYVKERKWCMKVDVIDAGELEEVLLDHMMSPLVRLKCDVGNPLVNQTNVAWDSDQAASYNESFFVDVKESNAMFVSVWSKGITDEQFVGRGFFEFNSIKGAADETPGGHAMRVVLYNIQHNERRTKLKDVRGFVNLRIQFLDPLKEACGCGGDGEEYPWMLPKHRMQYALSKMGGNPKMGQMLSGMNVTGGSGGHRPAPAAGDTPAVPPPMQHSQREVMGLNPGAAASTGQPPSASMPGAVETEEDDGA